MISFHKQMNVKVCRYYIGIFSSCVSFVKSIFACESFSICLVFFLLLVVFFSVLMWCKPCFYFIFRNNVFLKTVSGEGKAVTHEMVVGWNETTLPTLLSNYGLENIYNGDELGLFYQCLPYKSYQLKIKKCSGGKHSKIRITGLAAVNAIGNKLPTFVIDSVLFEEWLRDVNKKLKSEERKVALIIGNCPAHPIIDNLLQAIFFCTTKYYISVSVDGSRRNKMSQGSLQETISKADTTHSRF